MATPKALEALQKTKEALAGIKSKLQPVLAKLQDDTLESGARAQGHATVALSLGMMKYMGARLRGLDQGRKPDDPLRQELNNMRKVLAELKEKYKPEEVEKRGTGNSKPKASPTPKKITDKQVSNDKKQADSESSSGKKRKAKGSAAKKDTDNKNSSKRRKK
jgi:hypothetical protein